MELKKKRERLRCRGKRCGRGAARGVEPWVIVSQQGKSVNTVKGERGKEKKSTTSLSLPVLWKKSYEIIRQNQKRCGEKDDGGTAKGRTSQRQAIQNLSDQGKLGCRKLRKQGGKKRAGGETSEKRP